MNNRPKTKAFLAIALFFSIVSFAQLASDKLFEDHYGKKGVTSFVINKSMFQLFANVNSSTELQEFKEIVSQLDKIVIMTVESDEEQPKRAEDFYKKTKGSIPKSYKQMMHVKKEKETVTIYLDEKNDKIRELVMLIGEPNSTVLLSISGNIDLEKLAKLSEMMDISGFENLDLNQKK
jgi:pentose-5-phosphate-3-epimerase